MSLGLYLLVMGLVAAALGGAGRALERRRPADARTDRLGLTGSLDLIENALLTGGVVAVLAGVVLLLLT